MYFLILLASEPTDDLERGSGHWLTVEYKIIELNYHMFNGTILHVLFQQQSFILPLKITQPIK